ncbi:outer membrane beta-barrel family protein [Pedobacter sp. CFBP9032]|uniref:outer membrane beta-barrel family protein n=1 Tax=Pedobacter sp. CFBP9032 TaxID=3096539 RepID=UPI002A6A50EB|nr:outer membrane beta-barrel family protein [Pedobacter sp. CFBP9032]MDY0903322.1 outer membrane beta-barrel family protein [Pedobacter sp. CFBP9032]
MINYKSIPTYLFIFLLTFCLKGYGQGNTGIILKGKLKNENNEPVEGATLLLKDAENGQVVKQELSEADGTFSFAVSAGSYVLAVSYLGAFVYQNDQLQLSASVDLGELKIKTANLNLKEIVIQSSRNQPLIKVEGRKMIYNVQRSITAQGSTALEALKKTPGVMVKQDNSVSINGASTALVMINGRQTYLQAEELAQLLKSISASDLKSIEIIKNPSAEYDAAGTGGIVNLVLQKSTTEGFNGSINNGLAYGKTIKQNTNLNLNFRQGKLNMFGSYNHSFGHYAMDYDNDRTTNGKVYLNANHDVDKKHHIASTLGADYAIDTTKTIGVVLNGNFSAGGGLITPVTGIYDQLTGRLLQTLRSQSSYPEQMTQRYNTNLNYRYKGTDHTTLDIDADYGIFDASTSNLSTNAYYNPSGEFQSANKFLVANSRNIKLYALKADYSFKIGKGKMLTGAKFSSVNAKNVFDQYDANGSEKVIDISLSNSFNYKEQISAAYVKYETSFSEDLAMDLGLRLENTHSTGDLQPRDGSIQSTNSVVRNYLNIFPTASITYKTKGSGTYNLSFARRIDRPAYNNLNPFSYPVDELSYWKGNPFLRPQYANTLALQYSYKKTTISASYTHTNDISNEITEVLTGNVINMIPRNIGFQNNLNMTVTQELNLAKWWNVSFTAMGYLLENKVGTIEYGNYSRQRFAGTINVQQNFNLPGEITAEFAGVVNSKNISGLNTDVKGNSQVDLGFQRNLMNKKATLRLAVSDLFRANKIITDTQLNNLLLHTTYAGETRQIRLNFTYRFGNNKVKTKDARESGLQNESQRL